jgi:cytochrome c oxidase subunit 2
MNPGAIGISGRIVENVFLYIAAISVSLLVLITFLMVYFVIRYQRKRHPQPVQVVEKTWLEVSGPWSRLSGFDDVLLRIYRIQNFEEGPEGAFKIKVTATMVLLFEYPMESKRELKVRWEKQSICG